MCGCALGCRSDIACSRQSDCHRTAASRRTPYIALTSSHVFAGTSFQARPFACKAPIFIPTGGVRSIDRNETSPPGELLLVETHADYSDGGSQVLWEDGERVFRRGWRLDDDGERHAVLIVLPAAEHPSRSSLDQIGRAHV